MVDIKSGQRLTFMHRPGAGIQVEVHGTVKGTIPGDDFASAFLDAPVRSDQARSSSSYTGMSGIAACCRTAGDNGCQGRVKVTCALDSHAPEEYNMNTGTKRIVALFVEKSQQQWVVQDPEGNFWLLPSVEDPWGQRRRQRR
jgi:hypothetical protein